MAHRARPAFPLHIGSKRAHMPEQIGGLSPIRTAHHFKRTYVSVSIEYSVEPVNHTFF